MPDLGHGLGFEKCHQPRFQLDGKFYPFCERGSRGGLLVEELLVEYLLRNRAPREESVIYEMVEPLLESSCLEGVQGFLQREVLADLLENSKILSEPLLESIFEAKYPLRG